MLPYPVVRLLNVNNIETDIKKAGICKNLVNLKPNDFSELNIKNSTKVKIDKICRTLLTKKTFFEKYISLTKSKKYDTPSIANVDDAQKVLYFSL